MENNLFFLKNNEYSKILTFNKVNNLRKYALKKYRSIMKIKIFIYTFMDQNNIFLYQI